MTTTSGGTLVGRQREGNMGKGLLDEAPEPVTVILRLRPSLQGQDKQRSEIDVPYPSNPSSLAVSPTILK